MTHSSSATDTLFYPIEMKYPYPEAMVVSARLYGRFTRISSSDQACVRVYACAYMGTSCTATASVCDTSLDSTFNISLATQSIIVPDAGYAYVHVTVRGTAVLHGMTVSHPAPLDVYGDLHGPARVALPEPGALTGTWSSPNWGWLDHADLRYEPNCDFGCDPDGPTLVEIEDGLVFPLPTNPSSSTEKSMSVTVAAYLDPGSRVCIRLARLTKDIQTAAGYAETMEQCVEWSEWYGSGQLMTIATPTLSYSNGTDGYAYLRIVGHVVLREFTVAEERPRSSVRRPAIVANAWDESVWQAIGWGRRGHTRAAYDTLVLPLSPSPPPNTSADARTSLTGAVSGWTRDADARICVRTRTCAYPWSTAPTCSYTTESCGGGANQFVTVTTPSTSFYETDTGAVLVRVYGRAELTSFEISRLSSY